MATIAPSLPTVSARSKGKGGTSRTVATPFESGPGSLTFSVTYLETSAHRIYPAPLTDGYLFLTDAVTLSLLFFAVLLTGDVSSASSKTNTLSIAIFGSTAISVFESLSYAGAPFDGRQGYFLNGLTSLQAGVVQFFFYPEVSDTSASWSKTVAASGGVLLVSSTISLSVATFMVGAPPGTRAKSPTGTSFRTSDAMKHRTGPRTLLYFGVTGMASSGSSVDSATTLVSGELLWRVSFP